MYAYIDESGDTGQSRKSSKNFILTVIIVSDVRTLDRLSKKVFSKKVKYKDKVNQLHANKDTDSVHKYIIKNLDQISYDILYINGKDYFKSLESLLPEMKSMKVKSIFISNRFSNKSALQKINKIFYNSGLEIEQTSPTKVKGLQIADFVSWSIYKYLEHKDDTFFLKLKNIREVKTKP